jgi:FlaA1/EpsC-like NDP-sugar epimerase
VASNDHTVNLSGGSALGSVRLPSAEQIVVRADRATLDRIETLLTGTGATWRRQADRAPTASSGIDPALLIGRQPTPLDAAAERRARIALTNKRVLITGAGGSIGSEMARKVAALDPSELILMERSENALFEIDREIRDRFPRVKRRAMLHDVVDYDATMAWLLDIKPQTVFHAAAHKHVPIMEDHPAHAVNNNVFGTLAIADAARAANAERFVMISTDKAVNPRSVMGATKRMAEVYVRSLNHAGKRPAKRRTDIIDKHTTKFSTVRFGNVLGSAGSVVPVWEKQLAEGGPVTVTHPEMTRFFMTIPEAAGLVIQAGSLSSEESNGAEVFVLDMGTPVRIVELAERFVRLHGFDPILAEHGRDIVDRGGPGAMPIVFTGVRPGEKLHEELAHASEELRPTPAAGVEAWAAPPGESDAKAARAMIALLEDIRYETDHQRVLSVVRRLCPTVGEPEQSPSQQSEDSRSAA